MANRPNVPCAEAPRDVQGTLRDYSSVMVEQIDYQSYLIRFQRSDAQSPWRVTLQDIPSGRVLYFASEEELVCHLRAVLGTASLRDKPSNR